MAQNPRNYPETMISAESGRPMTRGEKLVSFTVEGQVYSYKQPGWWCSLTDPDDTEGELVDGDNQVADMARRTAKALAHGEKVFVPVVIRAIRQRCGLTQREAGIIFGTGEKSFEKYESGEITPSAPTKRLLRLAMEKPELFQPGERQAGAFSADDSAFVHETLRAAQVERLYEPLFAEQLRAPLVRSIGAGGAHSDSDITLALDEEEAVLATSAPA
jgi:HTH-type transcriptional regulator/antitoxin MqsA